jgi:hypothetical protein
MKECKQWNEDTWNHIDFGLFGRHACSIPPSHKVLLKWCMGNYLSVFDVINGPSAKTRHSNGVSGTENKFSALGLDKFRRNLSAARNPLRRLLVVGIHHWIVTGNSDFQFSCQEYPIHMRNSRARKYRLEPCASWYSQ